jgi:hypothetical protein
VSAAATTVEAATTEAATAVESTTSGCSVEATGGSSTVEPTSRCTTAEATTHGRSVIAAGISAAGIANTTAIGYGATTITTPVPAAIAAPVSATTPVTVIPGTGTDEEATDEPARTVVAVGCTCIRIVGVVAPLANWRCRGISISISVIATISHPNTNGYLGMGGIGYQRGGNHEGPEQQKIS